MGLVLAAAAAAAAATSGQASLSSHTSSRTWVSEQLLSQAPLSKGAGRSRRLATRTSCGSWDQIGDRCYFLPGVTTTFAAAQALCQARDPWATPAQFDNGTPFTDLVPFLSNNNEYWVGMRMRFNGAFRAQGEQFAAVHTWAHCTFRRLCRLSMALVGWTPHWWLLVTSKRWWFAYRTNGTPRLRWKRQ